MLYRLVWGQKRWVVHGDLLKAAMQAPGSQGQAMRVISVDGGSETMGSLLTRLLRDRQTCGCKVVAWGTPAVTVWRNLCGCWAPAPVRTMGSSVIISGVWESRPQLLWAQGADVSKNLRWAQKPGAKAPSDTATDLARSSPANRSVSRRTRSTWPHTGQGRRHRDHVQVGVCQVLVGRRAVATVGAGLAAGAGAPAGALTGVRTRAVWSRRQGRVQSLGRSWSLVCARSVRAPQGVGAVAKVGEKRTRRSPQLPLCTGALRGRQWEGESRYP